MKHDLNRRKFLKSAIAGGLGVGISTQVHGFNILSAYPVQDKHRIAVTILMPVVPVTGVRAAQRQRNNPRKCKVKN